MAYTSNLCVVAAICGNFWQESTVNPGVWENLTPGDPGYGLGQWTDMAGIVYRRTALFNYLDSHGYARDSGEGQLEFLIYEDVWNIPGPSTVPASDFSSLSDFLASTSTNIEYLTLEWMYHWEGIDDTSEDRRIAFAESIYTQFLEDDGTRMGWYTGNYLCSETEARWNSLLIKDFLYGTSPGPGPDPPHPIPPHTRRKGLPPWFIAKL